MNRNIEILKKFIDNQSQRLQDDISKQGYKDNSPYKNNPSNTIYGTPQGTPITMKGVSTPLIGMDEFGNKQNMQPGQEYFFPGTQVTETRTAKYGGLLNKTVRCSNCGWSWKAADGGNDVSSCHKCGNENNIMQNGGLTFLQPDSDKLPEGYRIPYVDPSTERAGTIGGENGEPAYLVPSFKYGHPIYDPVDEFRRTGEHLGGPFKTWQEADEWERTVRHPAVENRETIMFPQEQFQYGGAGMMYADRDYQVGGTKLDLSGLPKVSDFKKKKFEVKPEQNAVVKESTKVNKNIPTKVKQVKQFEPLEDAELDKLNVSQQVYDQINHARDWGNDKKNYGVVDKGNNVMYYVNPNGEIIGHENVITGATNKDEENAPSMLEYGKTANEYYDYLKNTNQRVTPAGVFTLHSNKNNSVGKPHSLVDRMLSTLPFTDDVRLNTLDDPSLMHAMYNEMPWREEQKKEYYEHRKESYGPTGNMFRMVSQYGVPSSKGLHGTGNVNRIKALNTPGANKNLSNGCINVGGETICNDILKDKSKLYVLPEVPIKYTLEDGVTGEYMNRATIKNQVYDKFGHYTDSDNKNYVYEEDRPISREDIKSAKSTKNKVAEIIKKNKIKATPEEIDFVAAVAQKETKGGKSWLSKAESFLPGFSSYGLYEQKESFPFLKGKSPNDEAASTQAVIDFYRDTKNKHPELEYEGYAPEKIYSTYNSGKTDWNTSGIYHGSDFRKSLQAVEGYQNGGLAKAQYGDSVSRFKAAMAASKARGYGNTPNQAMLSTDKRTQMEREVDARLSDKELERKARMRKEILAQGRGQFNSTQDFKDANGAIDTHFRLRLRDNIFDDYLNPAAWVGSMANKLGAVPDDINKGNYGQAAMAFAEPLAFGAGEEILAPYISKGLTGLKNIKTSIAPELREGLHQQGFFDFFKRKPKSDFPNYRLITDKDLSLFDFNNMMDDLEKVTLNKDVYKDIIHSESNANKKLLKDINEYGENWKYTNEDIANSAKKVVDAKNNYENYLRTNRANLATNPKFFNNTADNLVYFKGKGLGKEELEQLAKQEPDQWYGIQEYKGIKPKHNGYISHVDDYIGDPKYTLPGNRFDRETMLRDMSKDAEQSFNSYYKNQNWKPNINDIPMNKYGGLTKAQVGQQTTEPTIQGAPLEDVVFQGKPSEFGALRGKLKGQKTWEDFANENYLGNFERSMGQDINNLPEYRKQEYEDYINRMAFDDYVKLHPKNKGEKRGDYINRIQNANVKSQNFNQAYEQNAEYNPVTDENVWHKSLVGLGRIVSPAITEYLKQSGHYYSNKEKQQMREHPISTGVKDVMGTIAPLEIPANLVYGDKSFGDTMAGHGNRVDTEARLLGDPSMLAFEAAPLIGKGLSAAGKALGTEEGLLSNAYKLNPYAFKPNESNWYRQVGKSAVDDVLDTGLVREAGEEVSPRMWGEFQDQIKRLQGDDALPHFEKMKQQMLAGRRPISPFFNKGELFYPMGRKPVINKTTGKLSKNPAGAGSADYLIETSLPNESFQPAYVKGMYLGVPEEIGSTAILKPNPELRNLENFNLYKKNWLQGYKEVPKTASKFKSEINWGSWNKEIPNNTQLMKEYNAIEQQAKADGRWMKNPDGSSFQGTPEQFVQQNSENFKKYVENAKGNYNDVLEKPFSYHGSSNNNITEFHTPQDSDYIKATADTPEAGIFLTNEKSLADIYATKDKNGKAYELYAPANYARPALRNPNNIIETSIGTNIEKPILTGNLDLKDVEYLKSLNYTGIADHYLPNSSLEKVVFDKNIIKSAVGNNGMFDMTNPNIYKSVLPVGLGLGAAATMEKKKTGGSITTKQKKALSWINS